MKLKNVEIRNYRLLNNLTKENNVNVDKETTLIVGKNNSGKTSFSHLFELFLRGGKFNWEDFPVESHNKFIELFQDFVRAKDKKDLDLLELCYKSVPNIEMLLTLEYTDLDNWSNIRPLLTSLDDSNLLKISFSYTLEHAELFFEHLQKECNKKNNLNIIEHVSKIYSDYFKTVIRPYSDDGETIQVTLADIQKLIGTCFIAAQREVDDGNSKGSSKLSSVFQKEYKNRSIKKKVFDDSENELEALTEEMLKANTGIESKLDAFFAEFVKSYSKFGYPNMDETTLILKSNMTIPNLFQGIKLFYKDNEHLLPEKYNGLGYSNLIYIISEILIFKSLIEENGTDLNIIFIEEPEAHMHPQLQSVLIQRITAFLEENQINAQIIITTHSSHIVSNSSFESIRYFFRKNKIVLVKDMMKFSVKENKGIKDDDEVETIYSVDTLQFLKRYITLVKCDMFFADKIILIEGLCERLLMPLFFKKIDEQILSDRETNSTNLIKPLAEQYISLIEVSGAYMHKFKEFLDFLGVKTLIITDIDSCRQEIVLDGNNEPKKNKDGTQKKSSKKCEVREEWLEDLFTTNPTLKEWLPGKKSIKDLLFASEAEKQTENIGVTYQTGSTDSGAIKCGRTFEEAFLIDNAEYIFKNRKKISSIGKALNKYSNANEILEDSYSIYTYIDKNDKKSNFAFDLMYVTDWIVPLYIKEGLLWLAK